MINFPTHTWKVLTIVILLLRVIPPLFIFVDPFWIAILLALLDEFDYNFFINSRLFTYQKYQFVDKILDVYYLAALFLVCLPWQVTLLTVLYIYRLIGFVVVYLFKNRKLFILFPNVFEYIYWPFAYAFTKDPGFLKTLTENIWLFLIPIFLFKIYIEYQIHIKSEENIFFRKGLFKRSSWAAQERAKAQKGDSPTGWWLCYNVV